ncbi:NAD(P)H-binding protein [Streptomyces antimycoticus]|uniref:NAD(P)H-binding protein n=1 Tax=Streptomyces antimycoticus TaxID=68175 RepID=UPI000A37BD8D|nr:NAD(P)H-binding protein [Streptomyces antimycoticus]WJE00915.1 NAD(P)H-binding protein [Streptomyces antimycoticus]WTA80274.1 NAD(P)H-binding protein [Streptomyces antimycoticus]
MRVVVLGIATGLGARLSEALLDRGLTPVGLVRKPEQQERLRAEGVKAVLLDTGSEQVRDQLLQAMSGAGGVVLAAGTGTGPGSLGAATAAQSPAGLLSAAAEKAGVPRYVMVSALQPGESTRRELGADLPAYLAEKENAERSLGGSALDWCVLRPGPLDDSAGSGRVLLRTGVDPRPESSVARADVAATICELLIAPEPARGLLAVSAGTVPVRHAVAALRGSAVTGR